VKVAATNSGKGLGQAAGGQSVTYVKGNKMRAETQVGDNTFITVIDLDAQKMISLNPKKKEAEVYDLAKMRADLEKSIGAAEAKVSFAPNGQTKTVMGMSCQGYDVSISMPTGQQGMEMTMVLAGPVWIAKGAPGFADYATFYKAAAEKGMFFSNPQQAKAQPAQAKGLAEMYRAIAGAGMPLEQEISIKMEGSGPLAGMMAKVGNMSMSSTVTAISTDPLGEDLFAVPGDYKVKNR
jgi:hypothetical protein